MCRKELKRNALSHALPSSSSRRIRPIDPYRLGRLGVGLLLDTDFIGKFDELL